MKYTNHFNTKNNPQTQPIPGKSMVANNAGGFSFSVDEFKRLERFLILGSEGGSYYASEQALTQESAQSVIEAIKKDGPRVVSTIVDISTNGRAYRNDPAIFALALACTFGNAATKKLAYAAIIKVCRIGTHIFNFCEAVQAMRGWSAGLRKGVAAFYTIKNESALALQLVKYRQRNGWTHRDVLRLAHPSTTGMKNNMFRWAVGKDVVENHVMIEAFLKVQDPSVNVKDKLKLVQTHNLPWETLPTDMLGNVNVWQTLLPSMGVTAALRNLGKMTSLGMFASNLNDDTKLLTSKFGKDEILNSRIHPMQILLGLKTYGQGHGTKGNLLWTPNQKIVDTLDDAFYLAFKNVEPSGKNTMLALDVSGSMAAPLMNSPLQCREAAAAMSLVTANIETNYEVVAFAAGGQGYGGRWGGTDSKLVPVNVSPKMRINDVVAEAAKIPMGGTDCALPMLHALANNIPVETFVIYTDNETWAGKTHPVQALQQYRQKMGIPAKLVVVAMDGNNFTIADPNDSGMLDVVGFDSNTPSVIAEFSK